MGHLKLSMDIRFTDGKHMSGSTRVSDKVEWKVMANQGGEIHVVPTDAEHSCSEDCWCNPELTEDYTEDGGTKMFTHKEKQ